MDNTGAVGFSDPVPQDEEPMLPNTSATAPVYWARKNAGELITALKDKEQKFFDALDRRGLLEMWRVAYASYYGQDPGSMGSFETQQIGFDGDEGELIAFRINEARSFIRQQITMATSQRPAFKCMALNTDYSSVAQIDASDTIITYFYEKEMGEEKERLVVESDSNFGSGAGWLVWDTEAGDEVEVDTGTTTQVPMNLPDGGIFMSTQPVMEKRKSGAPVGRVIYPWELVREPNTASEHMWSMVRERASKWEVAALWPEHAEKIANVRTLDEYAIEALFGFDEESATEDDCIVKHFYHARCAAVPEGRYVGICGDVILWDRPCPVPNGVPIVEMCTSKFIGTSFGYADSWDLLSIGQMIDQICSDTGSNLSTFGRQVLVVNEGTDFDPEALANGMKVLTKQAADEMPQAIVFAAMPEAAKWFLEYLHRRMESISGLNSVARGNPDASVKSGQHAALFHSIALEFQSIRQASLDTFRKGYANLMLDLIRMNADAPFLVEVAGSDDVYSLAEFNKQSIAGVRRVRVDTANPMLRSAAGRLQIWQEVKDLDESRRAKAIELITTGQSKPLTRADRSCYLRIKWENEQLSQGHPVMVAALDNPFVHVPEHFAEIEALSPQLQSKPQVLKAYLAHIMEHLQQYLHLDPMLAAFTKIPPPPAMPPGMMPPGAGAPPPGAPPGAGGPTGEPDSIPPDKPPVAPNGGAGAPKDTSGIELPKPAAPPPSAKVAA